MSDRAANAKLIILGALLGTVLGALVALVSVCGIRLGWQPVLSEPAQVIFYCLWLPVSAITGGVLLAKLGSKDLLLEHISATDNKRKRLAKQVLMPFLALLFFLLYFSACALCQRLNMGMFHGGTATMSVLRFTGLAIAAVGLAVHSYALLTSAIRPAKEPADLYLVRNPILKLRHPCFFAALITLTGIPLVFGACLPLFAIPGIFVVLKWIVTEQEKILTNKIGSQYEEYQLTSYRLLPYLY